MGVRERPNGFELSCPAKSLSKDRAELARFAPAND